MEGAVAALGFGADILVCEGARVAWSGTGGMEGGKENPGFSMIGVAARLEEFEGPSGASSARRLARSTFSRKLIAASRLVMQYAASPSILLIALNLWMKYRLLIMLMPSVGEVIRV